MPSLPEYPNLNYGPGGKWIKHLTKNRLSTFTGGHFSDVNLSSMLFVHSLDGPAHVKLEVWSAPGRTKPSFKEAMQQKFKPAKKGDSFGPSWTNHWWKVSINIPAYFEQYERVQRMYMSCAFVLQVPDDGGDSRVRPWVRSNGVRHGRDAAPGYHRRLRRRPKSRPHHPARCSEEGQVRGRH